MISNSDNIHILIKNKQNIKNKMQEVKKKPRI